MADRPQLAAIAKMIDEAAERGADLTQHLLAFARKQPLQPKETDINALIVETAKLLRPTLGEHIEIESMLEGDAWPALVDPNQLATALLNLSLNARDAMPEGGKLTLETGNVHLDDSSTAALGELPIGPYVMIAVSDTGGGIPAAIRDKVFEPFFTTKDIGKGTGLGLSMVYGFVKQSGGHIKIYSEEGHGTTIKIYLPRAVGHMQQSAEIPLVPIGGGEETILVVEDDALVRDYVVAQLRSLGYDTLMARNAAEAIAAIDSDAEIDLLFTDVIMPGSMNGRQLADAARQAQAVAEGAVHFGLYRERNRPPRPPRPGRSAARQALSQVGSRAHGPQGLRHNERRGCLVPRTRSSRTPCGKCDRELRVQKGNVPRALTNFGIRTTSAGTGIDPYNGYWPRPSSYTMRTRSAAFLAPSFSMIRARCTSMVRGLIPSWRPASLLEAPATIWVSTSCSRRVNGSRPGK